MLDFKHRQGEISCSYYLLQDLQVTEQILGLMQCPALGSRFLTGVELGSPRTSVRMIVRGYENRLTSLWSGGLRESAGALSKLH